jgi:hypothetical protein
MVDKKRKVAPEAGQVDPQTKAPEETAAPAAPERKPGLYVKAGRAITAGAKGILGPGSLVDPSWVGGQENADVHVKNGVLERVK